MSNIKILGTGSYIPNEIVYNQKIEESLNLEKGYIEKRTGIKERHYAKDESIASMAIKAVQKILENKKKKEKLQENLEENLEENLIEKDLTRADNIGLIIVATTSSKELMPVISNEIQKKLKITDCICLDILAGCSGFINAFDIAKLYIETGRVKKALVVGVDKLSSYTDKNDIGTSILLADGAGAILLGSTNEAKKYYCKIQTEGKNNEILTCKADEKIKMNGKEIYKYAVTKTVENINQLLGESDEKMENIKYIVPHQSNQKIMKAIASRLNVDTDKMYTNIEKNGNTFCASIPIALDEMNENLLLNAGDKIILLGYGGGLNTGSIMLEI